MWQRSRCSTLPERYALRPSRRGRGERVKARSPLELPVPIDVVFRGATPNVFQANPELQQTRSNFIGLGKIALLTSVVSLLYQSVYLCGPEPSNELKSKSARFILLNSETIREDARYFAGRVMDAVGEDLQKQVERAYLMALARPPSPQETRTGSRCGARLPARSK